jgi:hypothetical protein
VGLTSKLIMHKDVNRDNERYGKLVDVKRVADNLGYCNGYGNRTVNSVLADQFVVS